MKELHHVPQRTFRPYFLFILITIAAAWISPGASARPHYRFDRNRAKPPESPIIPYNGGPVLAVSKTQAIFWGKRWSDPAFAQDEITGVDQLLGGMNGSSYLAVGNEYFLGGTGSSSYLGHQIDLSPSRKDQQINLNTNLAVNEVCRITGNNPDPNTVYFIITDRKLNNTGGYCAFHDIGSCSNGRIVVYAYMPAQYPHGECSPGDESGFHSQNMATVADNMAHEFMESVTDPQISGWYSSTDEIGDACSYTYTNANPLGLITLANGSQWRIQTLWSNEAYETGSGQPSETGGDPHLGAPGCVGKPQPTGHCQIHIIGPCDNYPSVSNAIFEDTWGEQHTAAGDLPQACAQRASDYHAWCGYSPVVQSTFTVTNAVTTVDCNIQIQGVCQNHPELNGYNGPDWPGMVSLHSAVNAGECAQRAWDYLGYCGNSAPVVSWYGLTGAETTATPTPPPDCSIGLERGTVVRGQRQVATLYCGGGPASSGYAVLSTHGNVIIWGCNQSHVWDPTELGEATVTGYVSGQGGANSCSASYSVRR